jgi:YbgC/YbaW family acyl-CoA thioester hydrolase
VRKLPESRDQGGARRVDALGAALGALALATTSFGLTEQRWGLVAAGGAVGAAFVVTESRVDSPMLPLAVFRNRAFTATNAVTFLLYGAFAVALFLLGLVLQGPLGYSPLAAGLATLPVTMLMLVFSARAGALAQRIGPRLPMTVGPLLVAAGLVTMTRIDADASYVGDILPGVVVFGLGLCLTVAPLTSTALGAVDETHAGIASGVNNALARTGQLVFVASVPILAGFETGAVVSGDVLVDGFHRVLLISAAVIVVAAAVSWFGLRRVPRRLEAAPPAQPAVFHCAAAGPPPAVDAPDEPARSPPSTRLHAMRMAVEPSTDPDDYPFAHPIRVRFAETDAMGIVHHSRYLLYCEEARVAYLRHIGHPYHEWRDGGADSAVLEAFLRYRQPLHFDDVVDVRLRLAGVTRATFQMAYLLTVGPTVSATGVTVHGMVNATGAPTRLPGWLVALGRAGS